MAIKGCSCKSEWMDKTYGKGKRVMNPTGQGAGIHKAEGWRCAACGREHPK